MIKKGKRIHKMRIFFRNINELYLTYEWVEGNIIKLGALSFP